MTTHQDLVSVTFSLLINLSDSFSIDLMSCLIYKMSDNVVKCQSVLLKAQDHVIRGRVSIHNPKDIQLTVEDEDRNLAWLDRGELSEQLDVTTEVVSC